jgi:hypothetical protein
LERLRIQMLNGCDVTDSNQSGQAMLDVTRTQHEQRLLQLAPGQSVALGVRRIHVLPTPLSSFTAYAQSEALAQALRQHPLLEELATRMKTRVMTRVEPSLGSAQPASSDTTLAGVAVVNGKDNALTQAHWLLARGASEILILPTQGARPQRVLIHWTAEQARRATLAVAASVLRHVPAQAIYLGFLPGSTPESQRPAGMRDLLDARSEAQEAHGLDMRTELRFGDPAEELERQLTVGSNVEAPDETPQMLILGISDAAELDRHFRSLLLQAATTPLLIVCRPTEVSQVISRVA